MRLVAKHAQVGYQTPGQRPGCRNCMHIRDTCVPYVAPSWVCDLHGLEVTSGGICPDFAHSSFKVRVLDDRTLPLEFPQLGEPA